MPRIASLPISIEDPEPGSHAIQCSRIGRDFRRCFQVCEPLSGEVDADLSQEWTDWWVMYLSFITLLQMPGTIRILQSVFAESAL
jgi:hypothetical protein